MDKKDMRKKAANKYFKSVLELKEERKHKLVYSLAIIFFILIVIKITVGEIIISIPFKYKDNRLYEVYLNDVDMTVEVNDERKITIIPYFLYIAQYNHISYQGTGEVYSTLEDTSYYRLKINSYNCYSEVPSLKENKKINYKVSCNTEHNYIKELNNDTTYSLFIKRTHKGKETILYEGKFIEDITHYLVEKGRYYIKITGTYKTVESEISFSVDKE